MPEVDLGKVRIENPIDGSHCFVLKRRAAERHVNAGRARWTSHTSIRFIESSADNQAARRAAAELEATRGYDNRGMLNIDEVRNLPALRPGILFHTRTKKTKKA